MEYSFFVAGHTYGAPGVNNEGFHPPFKAQFDYLQGRPEIELGILTGDIVSANPTAQDWDEIDAEIDSLGIPVQFAVGNHDMEDRPLFESRYGATYYSFLKHDDLFIILDPNIDGWSISGDQLSFLENTIQKHFHSCHNIFVFFHQVLWKEPGNEFSHVLWNSNEGRAEFTNFYTEILPLFDHLPNNVVMFSGDVGVSWASVISYDIYKGITFISSGMGHEDGENYVIVNVDSNHEVSYDLVCLSDPDADCLGEITDHLIVNTKSEFPEPTLLPYPNPSSDYFIISLDAKKNNTLEIFNSQGLLVFEESVSDVCRHIINIQNLSTGVYFLKHNTGEEETVLRLLVE